MHLICCRQISYVRPSSFSPLCLSADCSSWDSQRPLLVFLPPPSFRKQKILSASSTPSPHHGKYPGAVDFCSPVTPRHVCAFFRMRKSTLSTPKELANWRYRGVPFRTLSKNRFDGHFVLLLKNEGLPRERTPDPPDRPVRQTPRPSLRTCRCAVKQMLRRPLCVLLGKAQVRLCCPTAEGKKKRET